MKKFNLPVILLNGIVLLRVKCGNTLMFVKVFVKK